jgi:hypothetical protein
MPIRQWALKTDALTREETMPNFSGSVEIQDAAGNPTIVLDGESGDVAAGGSGQAGTLVVRDGGGIAKVSVDGQTGTIKVVATDGDPLVTIDGQEGDIVVHRKVGGAGREALRLDASDAALSIGGEGLAGDLTVRDAGGRDVLRFGAVDGYLQVGIDGNGGDIIVRDGAGRQVFHLDSQNAALYVGAEGNEGDIIVRDGAGRQVFRFDSHYAALYVGATGNEGDLTIRDNQGRDTIHLDGQTGDITLANADCAEEFEVVGSVDPGTVVVIGDGLTLCPSTRAYDKRVAGVVSGAAGGRPGIVLGRSGGSLTSVPVALMGRVHCKADAQFGSIEIGDLLTSSPSPGHAMKASDPLRAFGAVIGKALGPLPAGRGQVPVLVALQ